MVERYIYSHLQSDRYDIHLCDRDKRAKPKVSEIVDTKPTTTDVPFNSNFIVPQYRRLYALPLIL